MLVWNCAGNVKRAKEGRESPSFYVLLLKKLTTLSQNTYHTGNLVQHRNFLTLEWRHNLNRVSREFPHGNIPGRIG